MTEILASRLGEVVKLGGVQARLAGHLEALPVPGGVRPVRLPTRFWSKFPPDADLLGNVVSQSSGVRILIRTAATTVTLKVRCTQLAFEAGFKPPSNSFVATIDGEIVAIAETPINVIERMSAALRSTDVLRVSDHSTVDFTALPAGEKNLALWLPQGVVVDLLGIWGDAPIEPSEDSSRPVWIHHGSSISHCADPDSPTDVWPVVAAGDSNLDVINLGFSGQCMLDPFVADAIAATYADVISIKVGINIVGARSMDRRTFVPALHGFLDRIRVGHPDTPIILVSSILWPDSENTPGPSTVDFIDDGTVSCRAIGDPNDVATGALTLAASRDLVQHVVRVRQQENEHIDYLNGLLLYGEEDAAALPLPDGLHPNATIYREIGHRFARLVFGAEGIIPSDSIR